MDTTREAILDQIAQHCSEIETLAIDGKLKGTEMQYDAIRAIARKIRLLTAELENSGVMA